MQSVVGDSGTLLCAFLSVQEIAGLVYPRKIMVKEALFHKGDEAHSVFFIVSGSWR